MVQHSSHEPRRGTPDKNLFHTPTLQTTFQKSPLSVYLHRFSFSKNVLGLFNRLTFRAHHFYEHSAMKILEAKLQNHSMPIKSAKLLEGNKKKKKEKYLHNITSRSTLPSHATLPERPSFTTVCSTGIHKAEQQNKNTRAIVSTEMLSRRFDFLKVCFLFDF